MDTEGGVTSQAEVLNQHLTGQYQSKVVRNTTEINSVQGNKEKVGWWRSRIQHHSSIRRGKEHVADHCLISHAVCFCLFLFPCIIRSVRNVCFLFLTTVSELFRSVLDVLKCLTEDVLIWTEGSWVLSWRNQMAFVSRRSWIMMFPQRSPKPFTSWPNFILRMQRRNWSRKSPSTCSSCRWESIHCYLTWGRGSQGQRAGQLHILVFISLQRDLSSATKTF